MTSRKKSHRTQPSLFHYRVIGAAYSGGTVSFLTKGDDDTKEDESLGPALPRPVVKALFRETVPFLTKRDDDTQEDESLPRSDGTAIYRETVSFLTKGDDDTSSS